MISSPHRKDFAQIFQPTCLIANWHEDRALQRSALQDLLSKKATGTLRLDEFSQNMSTALAEVDLSVIRDDGYVHFGDVFQLVHVDTGAVMACDVTDKDPRPGEQACGATGAPEIRAPVARNTFMLAKYKPPRINAFDHLYDDDVLHYGQKVRLVAHPMALNESVDSAGGPRPLCLFSKPPSINYVAKYSRKQLVGFTYRHTYDSVWMVLPPDPSQHSLAQGVEVMAGAPITLVHCATNKPLCMEAQRYPNSFGVELELTATLATTQGLKEALEQTFKGISKGFLPKGANSDNFWTFVTGKKVAQLPEPNSNVYEVGNIVGTIAGEIVDFSALERKLVTLSSPTAELACDELFMVLRQVGCGSITPADVAILSQHYRGDSKPQGPSVYVKALLEAVRRAQASA